MIDKLDLRIPSMTDWAPTFASIGRLLRSGSAGPFRASRFYRYVGDLREYDIDAVLHLDYKFGEGTHKIEIIDAGKKTLSDMAEVVKRIFAVEPDPLEIMRVDLAADIEGIPVHWFRDNSRFKYKRFASRIEKSKESELVFVEMGTADAQSLYAGRKPNCIRIHNKVAEWEKQWRKIMRDFDRFNAGLRNFELTKEQNYYGVRMAPDFQQFCRWEGFDYHDGDILTRVERQIGGDRFPEGLRTFADLRKLASFNPFEALQIFGKHAAQPVPKPGGIPMRDFLAIKGLQQVVNEYGGMQPAVAFVQRYAKGNGKRLIDKFGAFLSSPDVPGITESAVFEAYRKTVTPQIS